MSKQPTLRARLLLSSSTLGEWDLLSRLSIAAEVPSLALVRSGAEGGALRAGSVQLPVSRVFPLAHAPTRRVHRRAEEGVGN